MPPTHNQSNDLWLAIMEKEEEIQGAREHPNHALKFPR
jgi:hypothetical protein